MSAEAAVERLDARAFRFPTDGPEGVEADGTLTWDSTTVILIEVHCGRTIGVGYTYGDVSIAAFIRSQLAPVVVGSDVFAIGETWQRMSRAIRNAGRSGVGAMSISAVDVALWDLKAKLLRTPLFRLLPAWRCEVPVYGSGGFTNYPLSRLTEQLGSWMESGIDQLKLKTSRHPNQDPDRLTALRRSLGERPRLMVDANGALDRKQATHWARRFAAEWNVSWFEEPVPSSDVAGLRLLRDLAPPGMDIAAGEYGYVLEDFAALAEAPAVDCLQADVTRCGGITGLGNASGLANAQQLDVSSHGAPAISAHACCAVPRLRHLEYFHDHVRVEGLMFDGVTPVRQGTLSPDPERPGLGLDVKWADIADFEVGYETKR